MGEKSAFFTVCFSSVREGLNIIIRGIVGFCFGDRDFMTASPPQTSFSFSEKEKEGKRKTAQGVPPRSEPRFAPANRDEIKSRGSMRLRAPRPPGERASRVRQTTEMLCTAEKVSVFGRKVFVCEPCGTIPPLPSPPRGSQGLRNQITQTIYLYHTNRKKPSFSFAPSERYLRSTPAARLSASVIPLP